MDLELEKIKKFIYVTLALSATTKLGRFGNKENSEVIKENLGWIE
jgi:hypothetical protein